jgi:hypothetical protein
MGLCAGGAAEFEHAHGTVPKPRELQRPLPPSRPANRCVATGHADVTLESSELAERSGSSGGQMTAAWAALYFSKASGWANAQDWTAVAAGTSALCPSVESQFGQTRSQPRTFSDLSSCRRQTSNDPGADARRSSGSNTAGCGKPAPKIMATPRRPGGNQPGPRTCGEYLSGPARLPCVGESTI